MRRVKTIVVLLVMVGLGFFASNAFSAEGKGEVAPAVNPVAAEAIRGWLTSEAVHLNTIEAGHGFNDLRPLKKVFKDVRVVGLGEATHGSREFFQFKHRMLEFLVEEMGFTVFAIEASYPACFNINDYVLYGKGDRAKALASQGFWTWDTNEVSDMIDWIRDYNKRAPENKRVKFLGFDLQHFEQSFDIILDYLKRVAPYHVKTAEDTLKPFRLELSAYSQRSPEDKARARASLDELIGFLSFNQTGFIRQTSPGEFEKVMQHARILAQFDDSYGKAMDPKLASEPGVRDRDYYMAENILYLLNAEPAGTRMVVWAHNGHISTSKLGDSSAMGSYLHNWLGGAYYALGFTFKQGSFQSREMSEKVIGGLKEFTVGAPPEGSVDWYFALPGIDHYLVDFRSAPKDGPVGAWLGENHPMRSVGSGFSMKWSEQQYMQPLVLKDNFDGMFFIDQTTRARPNPTGMRGPMEPPGSK